MRFSITGGTRLPDGPPELVEQAVRLACEELARMLSNELLGHWGEDEEGPFQSLPGLITGEDVAGQELQFSVLVDFTGA